MSESKHNLNQIIVENISNTILAQDRSVLLDIEIDIRKSFAGYEKTYHRKINNSIFQKIFNIFKL